jgi:hypothetical protein
VGAIAARLDPKTPVEIWFQDEMRLGQKNPRTCVFRTKSAIDSGMKSATDSDLISAIPI